MPHLPEIDVVPPLAEVYGTIAVEEENPLARE